MHNNYAYAGYSISIAHFNKHHHLYAEIPMPHDHSMQHVNQSLWILLLADLLPVTLYARNQVRSLSALSTTMPFLSHCMS
jgi:hypothetical protein